MDNPLEICHDDSLGDFIKSEYNNEGSSFRSPWSNKYFPDVDFPKFPPAELRQLEIVMNKFFREYTKLYYGETAVFSVFIWEKGDSIEHGFSCAILIKNVVACLRKGNIENKSDWDSLNIIQVKFQKEKEKDVEKIKATYKITSNVIFKISVFNGVISGVLSRHNDESYYMKSFLDNETHLEKIGKLVENLENILRLQIEEVYFKKTSEIIHKLQNSNLTDIKNNDVKSHNLANLYNYR